MHQKRSRERQIARWNATAAAQMPRAIDSHNGTDQTSATSEPAGPPDRAEPAGEFLSDARDQAGQRRGQHAARGVPSSCRNRSGLPASSEQRSQSHPEPAAAVATAHFNRRNAVGFARPTSWPNTKT